MSQTVAINFVIHSVILSYRFALSAAVSEEYITLSYMSAEGVIEEYFGDFWTLVFLNRDKIDQLCSSCGNKETTANVQTHKWLVFGAPPQKFDFLPEIHWRKLRISAGFSITVIYSRTKARENGSAPNALAHEYFVFSVPPKENHLRKCRERRRRELASLGSFQVCDRANTESPPLRSTCIQSMRKLKVCPTRWLASG